MSVPLFSGTAPAISKPSVMRGVVIAALAFELLAFCALGWAV